MDKTLECKIFYHRQDQEGWGEGSILLYELHVNDFFTKPLQSPLFAQMRERYSICPVVLVPLCIRVLDKQNNDARAKNNEPKQNRDKK